MARQSGRGGSRDHGKKDTRDLARQAQRQRLRDMAKEKPAGASAQELLRQDIAKHGPNPEGYRGK